MVSHKSNGEDGISVSILKKINNFVASAISELINQIFYEGESPNCLIISIVILICLIVFKTGSITLIGNYSQISVLSNLKEIIEKVIYSRLYSFFTKYYILWKLLEFISKQCFTQKSSSVKNKILKMFIKLFGRQKFN